MTKMLHWGAVRLSRRRLLNRTTTLAFGLFAGLAAGVPQVAYAGGCSGTACSGCNCNGATHDCQACGSTACQNAPAGSCIENQYCWSSSGHLCCDCDCRSGSFGFRCYCHYT